MKLRISTYLLVTTLFLGSITPTLSQSPEQLFQKGLVKEEGEGALNEAIDIYTKIVDNQEADKSLQAKALLHVGQCYEKLGRSEATKAYQQLVNNFPGQKSEVAIAKQRLSKLIQPAELVKKNTAAKEPEGITIKQVWTGSDVDNCGSVSLDGKYLSFVDWDTGDLAIRNLVTRETKRVTNEATWDEPYLYADLSVISPNGKQIAYQWYNGKKSELKLIDLKNKLPIKVSSSEDGEIYPALWFSDNEKLIVQRFNKIDKIYNSNLSSFNIRSGEMKLLIKFEDSFISNAALSPDEKYIAFDFPNAINDGKFDINLLSVDGKNEIPLIKHPANDRLLGYAPNRNEFLFISDRSGTTDVWAINTSNRKSLDEPKRILTNIGDIYPMGFTREGSLFFSTQNRKFNSFIVSTDEVTGKLKSTSRKPLLGSILDVIWLEDGESIICNKYILTPSGGGRYQLSATNSITGKSRDLAENIKVFGPPRLSPDNKSILIFGLDVNRIEEKDYVGGIFSVDIKTGFSREIKVKQDVSRSNSVEWDKNGKNIFYTSSNKIIRHNIDSGDEKTIYMVKKFDKRPTLRRSFDGNNLLFDVWINKENHLLSIPVEGGEAKTLHTYLAHSPLRYKKISLSPDGKYIYFTERTKQGGSILNRMPAQGGMSEKIWQSKDPVAGIGIHPDGKLMAISVFEQEVEIRVMENLIKEVEKIYSENE